MLKTKADLQQLIDDEIQESLVLEYKQSRALDRSDQARRELCKDVSAFANAAGGQIIYGIVEQNQKPVSLDSGAPNDKITREWIEQVVNSLVQPRIEGLVITPIPFDADHTGYVITIPQATARAPHQAPDRKYYKRQNFQSVPMEDYEIRDALRRTTTPDLAVTLAFADGNSSLQLRIPSNDERYYMNLRYDYVYAPVDLYVQVTNQSNQPAFHVVVQVGVDATLQITDHGPFRQIETRTEEGVMFDWVSLGLMSPPMLPLFKEADPWRGALSFILPPAEPPPPAEFYVMTVVKTPGFEERRCWVLKLSGVQMKLRGPYQNFRDAR